MKEAFNVPVIITEQPDGTFRAQVGGYHVEGMTPEGAVRYARKKLEIMLARWQGDVPYDLGPLHRALQGDTRENP